jgi:hypothetical protein
MSSPTATFIVRVELHPSDPDQAYHAVHAAMERAGFSRIFRDQDGLRYHLPTSEYCITAGGTASTIRDLARNAAGNVTTQFMLLVSDARRIAFSGLVPVTEHQRALPPPTVVQRPGYSAAVGVA